MQAARGKSLKVLISIGGWSLSNGFSQAADASSRAAFVSSCIDTFIKGNLAPDWITGDGLGAAAGLFDGIDIDWEYPTAVGAGNVHTPADRHNATLLLEEFRSQLDAIGKANNKHYLLTAALPAAQNSNAYWELNAVSKILDYDNVMTYDFHGASDPKTDFDSPLLFDPRSPNPDLNPSWWTVGTVAYYLHQGVARTRSTSECRSTASSTSPPEPRTGPVPGLDNTGLDINSLQWDQTPTPTFHNLVDDAGLLDTNGTRPRPRGWQLKTSWRTGEPWLFNPTAIHELAAGAATTPTFISYEDPASVGDRALLVRALGLRGAFAWEISQDSNANSLISSLRRCWGIERGRLLYPDRVPDRLGLEEGRSRTVPGSAVQSSPAGRSTRLMLLAAGAARLGRVLAPARSMALTSMCEASHGASSAAAGEEVDHSPWYVGGREHLGQRDRRQRRLLGGDDDAGVAGGDGRRDDATSPSSDESWGAMTATTPVGSGTEKLKYGPATGLASPSTAANLSDHPAYQTQRSIAASTSAGLGGGQTSAAATSSTNCARRPSSSSATR